MRVLLINSNLKDDITAAPPIGLCYVASATEAAGHDVRVLDLCFRKKIMAELKNAVLSSSPEVIGISVRNIDNLNMLYPMFYLPHVREIIEFIRTISNAPIVVGGAGASVNPGGVLEFLKADYVVVSDGEETFVKLLSALQKSEPPENIEGVGSMVQGKFHFVPAFFKMFPSVTPDIGKWIDMRPYNTRGIYQTVQTTRGCSEGCSYCSNRIIQGNRVRARPAREVVDELEEAHFKYRPNGFEFVDTIFNDPADRAIEILEEIVRRPWKSAFTAVGISPKGLDKPLLDLMCRAGFRSLMLSPDSAAESMIQKYGKNFTLDDVMKAVEALNQTRLTSLWYFLVGGYGETNGTLQETLDFILKYLRHPTHPPYHIALMWTGVRIFPGTVLWNIAMKEGFINENTDILQPTWYLSESLDLDRAVNQMIDAAKNCCELGLGFEESYLNWSRFWSVLGKVFRMPKPYWRHWWGFNSLLIKSGMRSFVQPKNVAGLLRKQLERQGYRGPLLKSTS